MERAIFNELRCPYTGSPVSLAVALDERGEEVVHGLVATAAGEFPVLDGILRLPFDELREPIVVRLRHGDVVGARRLALDWPYSDRRVAAAGLLIRTAARSGAHGVALSMSRMKRRLEQALSRDDPFCDLVDRIHPGPWAEWQKYRFSMGTFLPVYPLLGLVKSDRYVLDFACGVGHAAYLLSRLLPPERLLCADSSFTSLLIAKRYFVPNAVAICLDGNFPLPFRDGVCSTVLCSDAFHFITAKRALAHEFTRVLAPAGLIAMAHLHNRLSSVPSGMALTPDAYAALCEGMGLEYRLLPERELIDVFRADGTLDLARTRTPDELAAAVEGLTLVASSDRQLFAAYPSVASTFAGRLDRLRVNPIYRLRRNGTQWALAKHVSSAYRDSIESRIPNYATPEFNLGADELEGATARLSAERVAELVRRFIMLDAPKRYARE